MRIDELNLTGLSDLSGLYDHVYCQRAILGEMLKLVRLVPLIPFLAFVSVSPISKKTAKRGKQNKQECSWSEGCGCGRWCGGVVLWVTVPDRRCPIAGKVGVGFGVIFVVMRAGCIISHGSEASGICSGSALKGGVAIGLGARGDVGEGPFDANLGGDAVAFRGACWRIGGGGGWCVAGGCVRERHACTSSPPEPPSEI